MIECEHGQLARSCNICELERECADLKRECEEKDKKIIAIESLRPLWAKGWSDDSIAAQVSSSALVELYNMLGVKTQTDAMKLITARKNRLVKAEEALREIRDTEKQLREISEDFREIAEDYFKEVSNG